MEIFVTGLGIISSIGNNVEECLQSFENHQSGIGKIKFLKTRNKDLYLVGEVKKDNEELAEMNQIVEDSVSRSILLALSATKEAIQKLPSDFSNKFRVGFFSGTTVGGMDKTESFFEKYVEEGSLKNISKIRNHDCGKIADYVCKNLDIKGVVTTLSTACSSSANSIIMGARMIKNGHIDIAIAGGADALTRFTLNGFNTLKILDPNQCKPLDETRIGLNIGEGAAYLVMMSDKMATALNQNKFCTISGYSNTNDSFHQTALSENGTGPLLAMKGALLKSGLQANEISYINMHGTGTRNNDHAEGNAIIDLFQESCPKLSATKSFTGHTLGASGAIEAVLSVLAIKNELIFPNFSFSEPMVGLNIQPETKFQRNVNINHVMSNSFGFGGNCSTLIFSKCQ
ncbi:MAG: beta-ketoacyl-[acyl-carrier-protein] synthase family protein [Bacteroidetes bacterium]|nr:beta-ketoacyl-[acyl-carrier-protein] synthase family protein [Bacteroidota bacterium]